jgi:hypothetical protein
MNIGRRLCFSRIGSYQNGEYNNLNVESEEGGFPNGPEFDWLISCSP